MREEGAQALSALNPPIVSSNRGLSCTQQGWATIFSGPSSEKNKCWSNKQFQAMPRDYHILKKVGTMSENRDLFLVWITGKGHNILGSKKESPHHAVYKLIIEEGHPGAYHGDETRDGDEAFNSRFKTENRSLLLNAKTLEELKDLLSERISYYNNERRHYSISYQAPVVFIASLYHGRNITIPMG
jgi:hypothetical protein